MIKYIFDGSFEGLLTAIHEAYYQKEKPEEILPQAFFVPDLFSQPMVISTDPDKAEKVYRAIGDRISRLTLEYVFYAYLSEIPGIYTDIFRYLRYGFKVGHKVNYHLTDDRVMPVHRASQKVKIERHRMLGLIRFRRAGEIYYASIEPDHNICGLVAPHFVKRLADQNWIIHDLKRALAVLYNQKDWVITKMAKEQAAALNPKDYFYEQLWQQYYESTAIKDRVNPKLQQRFMPVRYWKHLIEK